MNLVLMPGMDGTGVLFKPLLDALGSDDSASVVRYPGEEVLGYDALVPIVEGALPRGGRFTIVAESFSGPLALRVANRRPPGLAAVVLCASFISNPVWFLPSWSAPLVRPWLFRFSPVFVAVKALLGRYSSPGLRELFQEARSLVRPEVLAARARAIIRVNATNDLRSCPVPILYLRGTCDNVVSQDGVRSLIQARADIAVRAIAAPHLVLQVAPGAALAAIREFYGHGK